MTLRQTICLGFTAFILPCALVSQASSCRALGDDGVRLRSAARAFVGSTDSSDVAFRAGLGFSAMDSTRVVEQTDTRTCGKIATAVNAFLNTPGRARSVHVVALVNNGYFAFDPDAPPLKSPSEWRPIFVVSKQFAVLKAINAF